MRGHTLALIAVLAGGAVLLQGCASQRAAVTKKKKGKRPPRGVVAPPDFRVDFDIYDDTVLTDPVDVGAVSFYHDSLAGNKTANGERYRLDLSTCAHRTLPFGTIVVIEDVASGKRTVCRVNDRGPYVAGRVLDVSKRVARDLGMLDRGVIKARLRVQLPRQSRRGGGGDDDADANDDDGGRVVTRER